VLLHWFTSPVVSPPQSHRSDSYNQPPTSSDRAPPAVPKPKSVAPTPPTPNQQSQQHQLRPPKYTRASYHAADLSESDVSHRGPDAMHPRRLPPAPLSPSVASSVSSPDGRAVPPNNALRDYSAASAAPVAAAPPLSTYKEPTAPPPPPPQQHRQQLQQQQPKSAPIPEHEQQPQQSDGGALLPKWAGSGFRIKPLKKAAPVALPPKRSTERSAPPPGPPTGGAPLTQKLRAAIDKDQQGGGGGDQLRSTVPPASPRLAMASQSIKQVGGHMDAM
jgi:hypothetical protein